MTREEAKEELIQSLTDNHIPDPETIEMAIKALEQEPCEDCISRREAIKKFTYNYKGERIPDYDCDNFPVQIDIKTVKEMLRELPPVTPQYAEDEIQKMQDLEQAELEKAYELGKAEGQKGARRNDKRTER